MDIGKILEDSFKYPLSNWILRRNEYFVMIKLNYE